MTRPLALTVLTGILLVATIPFARAACFPWQMIVDSLAEKYGEHPAFIAVMADGSVMTIFINPISHTFTVVAQPNASTACGLTAGESWSVAPDDIGLPTSH